MKVSQLIIGLLIVGFFITGMYTVINDLAGADSYNLDVDDYSTKFDKTTNVSDQIADDYETIFGTEDSDQNSWVVDKTSYLALLPHAVSLVKNMIKLPFAVIGETINTLMVELGFDSWVSSFLLTVAMVFMIFGVISIILRYRDT